mgnify:CR=1 FL=1
MARVPIPKDIQAEILFRSDHTCAICRNRSVGAQIHHIDSKSDNNDPNNLIVLCPNDHDKASSTSTMSKSYQPPELVKYREDWEKRVRADRDSFSRPSQARLIRFDGKDTDTVYLELAENNLRAFQDSSTFGFLGFNWGNVDIYTDAGRKKFNFGESLTRLQDCRKVRVQFQNETLANEVYVIWDDGRKHHVPDPETMNFLGGFDRVEPISYLEFNTIPHGQPILDIFTLRTRNLLQNAMKRGVFGGPPADDDI